MYCGKCGKQAGEGTAFCPYCGEALGAGRGTPLAAAFESASGNKKKKSIMPAVFLAALLIAGGIGAALYFTSDGYKCKKRIEQAEQYLEEGGYEEALACCGEALELDDEYADAYLISADIYIELEAYGKAAKILEKGRKAVKDKDELCSLLEEKLDEVYLEQAEALVGVWMLNYHLADLIPEEYGSLFDLDMEIPILLEIREDGVMYFSVENEFFAGAQSFLSTAANVLVTSYVKLPFVGKMAGNFTDIITGLLIENIGVTYKYEVKEGVLHCVWTGEDASEEIYAFEIDGGTLTFLEERTPEVESYYLKFPLTLERV